MMLYKNTKAMVSSPDGDVGIFDMVAEVLQEDILSLFLFIINQNYVLRLSIDLMVENGVTRKKKKKKKKGKKRSDNKEYERNC